MKISIFGMGYVGVVSGACLVDSGHEVVGVDKAAGKVVDLQAGRSPIQEPGVSEMLMGGYEGGLLSATTDACDALAGAEMVWICVGTPSQADGGIDLSAVEAVIREIGGILSGTSDRPLIVLRSTSVVGTTRQKVIGALEDASGLVVGEDIDVVFHPEFLREGCAVSDFYDPPKIVVGECRPGAGDRLLEVYEGYEAPVFRLSLEEAELVKYYDNIFHAVKITFANELGAVAKSVGVDSRRVAEVFCADTKLNISSRYLRPGFAFGGSCLPKDLRALLRLASLKSVATPMLDGVKQSNDSQVQRLIGRVLATGAAEVGMVGLAFKAGTDDMRESPYVRVAKALIGEGVKVSIWDPTIRPELLVGSNKEQVQGALRHLEELLVETVDKLDSVDVILINHKSVDAGQVGKWLGAGKKVLDLVGIDGVDAGLEGYEGIYW